MNRQLNLGAGLLCLLLFAHASAEARAQGADKTGGGRSLAEEAAIRGVADRLFETMEAKQLDALRGLFVPEGRLVSTFMRQGQPGLRVLTLDDFIRMVAEAKEPYRERMFQSEVRVEGDVATLWGRYDFHAGARLTNCGYNSLQLVRTKEGWKILHIASTIITQGCQETK
jgi:hypothetical protein